MGDQGKYCFLYFMNYALLTCCLPLPPHSSATRAPKLWLKVLLPLMPSGYGRDSSPWRITQSCGENNKRPTQKAAACQKMKVWNATVHDVHCEMRHKVFSSGPSFIYVTTCDSRKLVSEVYLFQPRERAELRPGVKQALLLDVLSPVEDVWSNLHNSPDQWLLLVLFVRHCIELHYSF